MYLCSTIKLNIYNNSLPKCVYFPCFDITHFSKALLVQHNCREACVVRLAASYLFVSVTFPTICIKKSLIEITFEARAEPICGAFAHRKCHDCN